MRAAASYLSVLCVPLVATVVAVHVVAIMELQGLGAQVANMLLFASLTILLTGGVPRGPVSWRSVRLGLLMASIPCALMLGSQALSRQAFSAPTGVLVAGAALEEGVFRWLLPRRALTVVARALPPGLAAWAALVGPQVIFALSHVAARIAVPYGSVPGWVEVERIFVAGLLFQTIQLIFGVGAAVGAHVTVNYAVITGRQVQFSELSVVVLHACAFGGLLLLSTANAFHRRQVRRNVPTPSSRGS